MRSGRPLLLAIILASLLAIPTVTALAAPLAQERQAIITSPRDGAEIKGVVQISGTASDPKFDHYEMAWSSQNAPEAWQTFVNAGQPVYNGVLGSWNTTSLPAGTYSLRLRVVRNEDKFSETYIRNLSVNQGTATPAASSTPAATPTGKASPASNPITTPPTVVIVQQPPTATPQAKSTAKPGAAAASTPSSPRTPSIQVNVGSFGEAFCNGVLWTVLLFGLWGILWATRKVMFWVLRQMRTTAPRKD